MSAQNYGQPDDLLASTEAAAGDTTARPPAAALAADVALFLDVDGTLLDIAEGPSDVLIPSGLVDVLERAERKLSGAVALVSGRPIAEIDRLFWPLRLRASGVHGAEMRFDPGAEPHPAPSARQLPYALAAAVADAVSEIDGVVIERKTYSIAVHYRRAPRAEAEVRDILHRLIAGESASGAEISDAHFAFEVKMPGFDKGGAIAMFLETEPFVGRVPIFIGDDTTDEAGFAAVAARGGRAYSVGRWRPGAIGVFEDPKTVRAWLSAFVS